MIVCITGMFPKYDRYGFPTGEKELLVSHGVDVDTGKTVVLSNDHPQDIGAKWNEEMGEWILD